MASPHPWMLTVAVSIFHLTLINLHITEAQIISPITCFRPGNKSCTITPAFAPWADREDCKVASVVYPTTEEEIVAAVAGAVQARQKIKVISRGAHSAPKIVCPGGDNGLLISTSFYNSSIIVDQENLTATVDAGVRLQPFFDTLAQYGLAFPHSPYFSGMSISGVISTGAHGSGRFGKGGALHEYVVGMRLVVPATAAEGYAKVITLTKDDPDLRAAKLSLGVLGVISTVTLAVEPQFKRSMVIVERDDSDLAERLIENSENYEFGDVTWYPHMQMALYREDNRVPVSTPGEGVNQYIGVVPTPISQIVQGRLTEEFYEFTRNASGKCVEGVSLYQQQASVGFGFRNNATTFTGYPIVGFQNALQTQGSCESAPFLNGTGSACAWDRRIHGLTISEIGPILPLSQLSSFVQDVKALLALNPSSLCSEAFVTGALMRYVKKSNDTYLGYTADSVQIDFNTYRSNDPLVPPVNLDTYQEIEQILFRKYKARAHLGKNRPVPFVDSHKRFPNLRKFLEVKKRYDPKGFFSSEWSDQVFNIGGANSKILQKKPFCALESLCICSEDIHCNPSAYSFCRPGLVYTEARVCRYEGPSP